MMGVVLPNGEKASSTQLVSAPMRAESVNSSLSSTLPGTAFMHTMCAARGLTTNLCLTLDVWWEQIVEK